LTKFESVFRAAQRSILAIAILVAAAQLAAAQSADEFKTIPCQDSLVFLSPSLACVTAVGRGASDNRAVSGQHATAGHLDGVALNVTLVTTGYQTFIKPYGEDESAKLIKGYHKTTRDDATGWSAIKTVGNTSYMTFMVKQVHCIGFDHAGPLVSGGYEWLLRGFLCLPSNQSASFETLKRYLAATRIGPPVKNLNAFGEPMVALPAPPKPA
jgi:hypothetical protein